MKRFILSLCALAVFGLLHSVPAQADLIKQSTSYTRMVLMTNASDHITGATGLTLTILASKAGGTLTAITPTVTEVGGGTYAIALTPTHTNTQGDLYLKITATGADPSDTQDQIIPADFSSLPSAAPNTSGGLFTVGTGAGQLNPNGSGGLAGVTTALTGTATAGTSTTITLAAGPATTDLEKGNYVAITSGTGAGQARTITAWNGGTLVATVSRPWAVTPDATSVYAVVMNPHPALDTNLAVAFNNTSIGSVTGSVGSVTGSVGSVTSPVVVSSITGGVMVSSYATGQDPATLLLTNPANKLTTDSSGKVALTTAEHTAVQADVQAGLTAQGLTPTIVTTIAAQVARTFGAEWGSISKSGNIYSVTMPSGNLTIPTGGAAIGTVTPSYDSSGLPTTTTKTVQ